MFKRPPGVGAVAVLFIVNGVIQLASSMAIGVLDVYFIGFPRSLGLLGLFVAAIGILIGWGLWAIRMWARYAAMVVYAIGLLAIPIGTVVGVVMLWYFLEPGTKVSFHSIRDARAKGTGDVTLRQRQPYLAATIVEVYVGLMLLVGVALIMGIWVLAYPNAGPPPPALSLQLCGVMPIISVLFIAAYYTYSKDLSSR